MQQSYIRYFSLVALFLIPSHVFAMQDYSYSREIVLNCLKQIGTPDALEIIQNMNSATEPSQIFNALTRSSAILQALDTPLNIKDYGAPHIAQCFGEYYVAQGNNRYGAVQFLTAGDTFTQNTNYQNAALAYEQAHYLYSVESGVEYQTQQALTTAQDARSKISFANTMRHFIYEHSRTLFKIIGISTVSALVTAYATKLYNDKRGTNINKKRNAAIAWCITAAITSAYYFKNYGYHGIYC